MSGPGAIACDLMGRRAQRRTPSPLTDDEQRIEHLISVEEVADRVEALKEAGTWWDDD